MNSQILNLSTLLDLTKWSQIQDEIAVVTGLSLLVVDYKGIPVSKHSGSSQFCAAIRLDPQMVKNCQKCDARGGLEAARLNRPYIYRCHYNIIDVAIPIMIDEKYIGALMAGEALLNDPESESQLERISAASADISKQDATLQQHYNALPHMSLKRIEQIAQMLHCITNYVVEEAINKHILLDTLEKLVPKPGGHTFEEIAGYSLDTMLDIKRKSMRDSFTPTSYRDKPGLFIPRNPTLRPAIEYIIDHQAENVTLYQMAELCNTSPGYLSRLFKKETGESFTEYVTNFKINLSKTMLETTTLPISEISQNMGFSDTGYFIKRFKKREGVTPAVYRKYLKQ